MWWLETLEPKNSEMLNTLDTLKEYLLKFKLNNNLNTEDKLLSKKDLWIKPQQMYLEQDIYLLWRTALTEESMMIINILTDKRKLMKVELLKRFLLITDKSSIKKKDHSEDLITHTLKWIIDLLELNNQLTPEYLTWEVILIYRLILEPTWIPQPNNGNKLKPQLRPLTTIPNLRLLLDIPVEMVK